MPRYLKTEFLKFLYNRWALIILTGTVIFIPVMASELGPFFDETGKELVRSKILQALYLGQVGHVVMAGLYLGREYTGSALRTSLLAAPVRLKILAAKFVVICSASISVFALSTIFSILATGFDEGIEKLTRLLLPAFGSTMELVILTSSAVLISKSMIASMAVPVSLILGLGNLLLQYGQTFRFMPVISSMNGFFIREVPAYLDISSGLVVQGAWCLVLMAAGSVLFMRRTVR